MLNAMTTFEHLDQTAGDAVQDLCDFLRIPSISTQSQHTGDVQASAQWVLNWLTQAGLKAELWPTAGHPAVYVEWLGAPGKPTVLLYGHHDVQPTGELAKWTSPPFEPTIRNGVIYARGSADDKGQVFAQMRAVAGWLKATGQCPVNVKMLIEGEEEIGSPNLPALLQQRKDRLRCDVVALSDSDLYGPGQPCLPLGTRGVFGMEIKVIGPLRDLHSGLYGGSVPNPIAVLVRILAQLHDDRRHIAVPGFYDDVAEVSPLERESWKTLPVDEAHEMAELGCGLTGEEGYSTLERRWMRPTLEFNGITGGYQGPGTNTIVPSWASVKITCRIVPDQDPQRLAKAIEQYVYSLAPQGVRVEVATNQRGTRAYSCDPNHPAMHAAARAFQAVYGKAPLKVRNGATLPILPEFKKILGADSVLLGFCQPNCQAHSPDEFFSMADLNLGTRTAAKFLEEYANERHG